MHAALLEQGRKRNWIRNLQRREGSALDPSLGPANDVIPSPEDRSPLAVAYGWAWRIIAVSVEMVLPGLVGLWGDRQLGTWILFTLLGFAIGMVAGIWHLIRMTGSGEV